MRIKIPILHLFIIFSAIAVSLQLRELRRLDNSLWDASLSSLAPEYTAEYYFANLQVYPVGGNCIINKKLATLKWTLDDKAKAEMKYFLEFPPKDEIKLYTLEPVKALSALITRVIFNEKLEKIDNGVNKGETKKEFQELGLRIKKLGVDVDFPVNLIQYWSAQAKVSETTLK